MDSHSLFACVPIVYTRRLDEMAILRTNLNKYKSQDIIDSIISESKPSYTNTNPINSAKVYNLKQEYDEDSDDYEQNNIPCEKPIRKVNLSLEELKSKIAELNGKSKSCMKATTLPIKSEVDQNSNPRSLDKLISLLAMCRPLKVVLEDISKIAPKREDEVRMEVVTISSDSDDDDITIAQYKMRNEEVDIRENITSTDESVLGSGGNYEVKNKNEFQEVLKKEDLKNSVIVIYNLYLKNLDAYQIDQFYDITEYKTMKYSELYKFPMKKCKLIIHIIACCWTNRKCFVSLLLNYRRYNNIAKFINTAHPCKNYCTCCCLVLEQSTYTQDGVKTGTQSPGGSSKPSNSRTEYTGKSKLIATALKFKQFPKWKGDPGNTVNDNKNKLNYKSCNRLLTINSCADEVEYYEFSRNNVIYSKVVTSERDPPCWLTKTVSKGRNQLKFTYSPPTDREKRIIIYRQVLNIISHNTECFLRKPIGIGMDSSTKLSPVHASLSKAESSNKLHRIEHTRSFIGTSNKKSKIISILPEICKNKAPINPVSLSTSQSRHSDLFNPPLISQTRSRTPPQLVQSTIMEEDVAQTINLLIKDILHRFRNVLLTINANGEVSAALNAPLSSLTRTELSILAKILSHAQSQVDKLGLTPGTCLNPEAPMIINSTTQKSSDAINSALSETSATSTDALDVKKDNSKNKTPKEQNENINNKSTLLFQFSKFVSSKKNEYEKSFRSYLGETLEEMPKITNVFSINGNNLSANITESPSEKNIVCIEKAHEVVTNKTDHDIDIKMETINCSKLMTEQCLQEVIKEITMLDNDTIPELKKGRKRKTHRNPNTQPSKVKVKPPAKVGNEPSTLPVESPTLVTVGCDPMVSMPLKPEVRSYSNYSSDNSRLRSLLTAEPKKMKFSPYHQQVFEETKSPVELSIDNADAED